MSDDTYWAIIELMGHVRIAGRVSEVEMFGMKMSRVDIPSGDGNFLTQFFGGGSVYRETPCTEETARAVAAQGAPAPISPWEMPGSSAIPVLPPSYPDPCPDDGPWSDPDDDGRPF